MTKVNTIEALMDSRANDLIWGDYIMGAIEHDQYLELSRNKEKLALYLINR